MSRLAQFIGAVLIGLALAGAFYGAVRAWGPFFLCRSDDEGVAECVTLRVAP